MLDHITNNQGYCLGVSNCLSSRALKELRYVTRSTGWFQERSRAWFHNRTQINGVLYGKMDLDVK